MLTMPLCNSCICCIGSNEPNTVAPAITSTSSLQELDIAVDC